MITSEEVFKYLRDLTATNAVCVALGTTLTASTTLFVGQEPILESGFPATCCTILPYGSSPPSPEGDKREGAVQIRLRCLDQWTGLKTQASMISLLHNNTNVCSSVHGRVSAVQSEPIPIGYGEGGEIYIVVSNYTIKHTKFS
jgi:hypothetical protein